MGGAAIRTAPTSWSRKLRRRRATPPARPAPKRVGPAEFLAQVRDEGRKVTWPTRKETVVTTVMVFIMVVVASIFFTVVDQALRYLVTLILGVGA